MRAAFLAAALHFSKSFLRHFYAARCYAMRSEAAFCGEVAFLCLQAMSLQIGDMDIA